MFRGHDTLKQFKLRLTENIIATRYLSSSFLGHAAAQIMLDNITMMLSEDGLSLTKMKMLSSDGPNVNEEIKALVINLVNIGSWNLHPVHIALKIGVNAVSSWGDENFYLMFHWLKKLP